MSIDVESAACDARDLIDSVSDFAGRMNRYKDNGNTDPHSAMERYGEVYDLYGQAKETAYECRFDFSEVYFHLKSMLEALHNAVLDDGAPDYGILYADAFMAVCAVEGATADVRDAYRAEQEADAAYMMAGVVVFDGI